MEQENIAKQGSRGKVKARHLPKVISREEVMNLFDKVQNIRDKVLLKTIYWCGLRVSEAINIMPKDINFKERTLLIRVAKRDKQRMAVIPKALLPDLEGWVKLNNFKDDERIFKIQRAQVHNIVKKANPNIHTHTLRHSLATHLYERTGDIHLVKESLGHTNISTTQIYTHLSTKARKDMIDKAFDEDKK